MGRYRENRIRHISEVHSERMRSNRCELEYGKFWTTFIKNISKETISKYLTRCMWMFVWLFMSMCTHVGVCTHVYMIFFILISLHNSASKTFKGTTGLNINEVTVHTYEKALTLSVKDYGWVLVSLAARLPHVPLSGGLWITLLENHQRHFGSNLARCCFEQELERRQNSSCHSLPPSGSPVKAPTEKFPFLLWSMKRWTWIGRKNRGKALPWSLFAN